MHLCRGWELSTGMCKQGTHDPSQERKITYKLSGTVSRNVGSENVHKDQENVHIHLQMDNRTAVCYVNCMRDTVSNNEQTSDLALAVLPGEEPVCQQRTYQE